MDQPAKVATAAGGQLNRENKGENKYIVPYNTILCWLFYKILWDACSVEVFSFVYLYAYPKSFYFLE